MGEPILVVDDDPMNLKLVRVLLTAEGYDVRTAADGGEALAALSSFRPSLVLMDLELPDMDGVELIRRLKADPATRDIVVVALTAHAMKGDEEKALAAGFDGYIAKPIRTRSLASFVAARVASARARPGGSSVPPRDDRG